MPIFHFLLVTENYLKMSMQFKYMWYLKTMKKMSNHNKPILTSNKTLHGWITLQSPQDKFQHGQKHPRFLNLGCFRS